MEVASPARVSSVAWKPNQAATSMKTAAVRCEMPSSRCGSMNLSAMAPMIAGMKIETTPCAT